ncbi:MAG: hypothetical protein OEW12_07075 [Deltaproteobacteria bacterium]|nr:hypothetical protein [Deltaproteobacteria bacterium]
MRTFAFRAGFAVLAIVALFQTSLLAQEDEGVVKGNNPPQILTSDLSKENLVEESRLDVHFVFADADDIVEVTINGEKQNTIRGATVLVSKQLKFSPGSNMIEVVATDVGGNSRTKTYFVKYVAPEGAAAEVAQDEDLVPWRFVFQMGRFTDSNPLYHMLTPSSTPGQELYSKGTEILLSLNARSGPWTGSTGMWVVGYDTSSGSRSLLEEQGFIYTFMAGGYRTESSDGSDFLMAFGGGELSFRNVFALLETFSFGWESRTEGDTVSSSLVSMDLTRRDFPEKSAKDDTLVRFRWDTATRAKNRSYGFYSSLSGGATGQGGSYTDLGMAGVRTLPADSDGMEYDRLTRSVTYDPYEPLNYQYIGGDVDAIYRGSYGFRADGGLGAETRKYEKELKPNASRVRGTLSLGWEYSRYTLLRVDMTQLMNLSSKIPYTRTVSRLVLQTMF